MNELVTALGSARYQKSWFRKREILTYTNQTTRREDFLRQLSHRP